MSILRGLKRFCQVLDWITGWKEILFKLQMIILLFQTVDWFLYWFCWSSVVPYCSHTIDYNCRIRLSAFSKRKVSSLILKAEMESASCTRTAGSLPYRTVSHGVPQGAILAVSCFHLEVHCHPKQCCHGQKRSETVLFCLPTFSLDYCTPSPWHCFGFCSVTGFISVLSCIHDLDSHRMVSFSLINEKALVASIWVKQLVAGWKIIAHTVIIQKKFFRPGCVLFSGVEFVALPRKLSWAC